MGIIKQHVLTPKNLDVCFSSNVSAYKSNLYIDPAMNIIGPSSHVHDLGVSMSSNSTFDFHISNFYKRCLNLAGWILRTITTKDHQVMLTLYNVGFKSQLDSYFRNIVDLPCRPGFNNNMDGGVCLHGGHYADDLAAN